MVVVSRRQSGELKAHLIGGLAGIAALDELRELLLYLRASRRHGSLTVPLHAVGLLEHCVRVLAGDEHEQDHVWLVATLLQVDAHPGLDPFIAGLTELGFGVVHLVHGGHYLLNDEQCMLTDHSHCSRVWPFLQIPASNSP